MEGYGSFISRHRNASGYKRQSHFADKAKISAATISRIEKEIQKPSIETLKIMAPFLTTTSYVELMVACGYWEREELLEDLVYKYTPIENNKKTPSNENEEEFIRSIDIVDGQHRNQYELKIDGQVLTEDESNGIIAYIRSLRQMKNQNKD